MFEATLHILGPKQSKLEPRSSSSEYMKAILSAINDHPPIYNEQAALKIVEVPLATLKAASVEDKVAFVFEALDRSMLAESIVLQLALKGITSSLLRSGLPFNTIEAVRLLEASLHPRHLFPFKAILSAVEKLPMTAALKDALLRLRPMITEWHGKREMQEIHERIDTLVYGAKERPFEAAAGWTRQVFQEIDSSPKQLPWRALFLHARSLTQSSASRKWQSEAVALVERIGPAEFIEAAHRWLALGPMPGTSQAQVPEEEADYQKGFIWTLGALGDTSVSADIADFAFACFRKIPQIGAVSHRVGNACVNALSAMPGLDAVTQISRLAMRVKYDVARRLIEKALVEAAQRNNVSRDDLEAMSVPSYGLNAEGIRVEMVGDCQAKLSIENGKSLLAWSRDGKPLKSVPADVKSNHAGVLAEIKKAAKELNAVLSTQRLRLERQLLSQASCRFDRWKAWYIEHPVCSVFARNLIWEIETNGAVRTAIFCHGNLTDWAGDAIPATPNSAVRLWHPIRSSVQEVLSWRCWLEDHEVKQPFKQAHREVYILTDAERETATYSNRFAAHIVKQHQFAALCRERGWQFNLMGQWDSHNTPYLELPHHNVRAEFDVEFPGNEEISGHAIYLTLGTDKVQFFPLGPKPDRFSWPQQTVLPLDQVPPLVFSEVMRDVDLLVGVTSIGSDPAWNTNHRDTEPNAEYWNHFAFGELSTAAQNRSGVIERILPKLSIRNQCSMDGRYLVVRGDLHEYRIHMGSGNIIMEPGSRYLCIVQGPGDTAARLPLPFEGDRILAQILSKAFLLANDKSIKDETIRRQIR